MFQQHYESLVTRECPPAFTLPEWIALAPFEEFLGMRIDRAEDGCAVLSMPFRGAHCQGGGLMHGGAVVALADTSLAIAIKTLLPPGTQFATISMELEFHAPVRWGTLAARATVTDREGRDLDGLVELITEEGIKAATFRARFRIKRGQPGITD